MTKWRELFLLTSPLPQRPIPAVPFVMSLTGSSTARALLSSVISKVKSYAILLAAEHLSRPLTQSLPGHIQHRNQGNSAAARGFSKRRGSSYLFPEARLRRRQN